MKKRLNETFENFRRKNHEQNRTCSSSSQKAELSKKDAEKAVAAVTAAITDALCAGDKVQLLVLVHLK